MTIIRGPRLERDFTVLANCLLRDATLTYKARGLLACLLSQQPGFRVSAVALASSSPDGRAAVASGLKELEAASYLRRERIRRADGTFECISTVYESPMNADLPSAENLRLVPPAVSRKRPGQTRRRFSADGEPADKKEELKTEELEELKADVPNGTSARVEDPESRQLCEVLADAIATHRDGSDRPKITKRWLDDMRLLTTRGPLHVDRPEPVSASKVEASIGYLFSDLAERDRGGFCWADQIRSPGALRDHWHQLADAARRNQAGRIGRGTQAVLRTVNRMARLADEDSSIGSRLFSGELANPDQSQRST